MGKFYITLSLLCLIVLKTNSIFSQIYDKSYYNSNELKMLDQYAQRQYNGVHYPKSHIYNQRKKYHLKRHNGLKKSTYSNTKDSEAFLQNYMRQPRYLRRQNEKHYQIHSKHRQIKKAHLEPFELRSMPRIWQHLQTVDNIMINDEPIDPSNDRVSNNNYKNNNFVENPPLPIDFKNWKTNEQIIHHNIKHQEQNMNYNDSIHNITVSISANPKQALILECPKCENDRQVAHVTKEELTHLRIEFVKQQILEKLRLKKRPNISAVNLPKPIYEGTTIEHEDENSKNKELDDYYARTSKKFIFLKHEINECQRLNAKPSVCFSFKIEDADADGFDVNTAVLWIFKNKQHKQQKRNNTILEQQTILVSEVQQALDLKYLPIIKTIAIQTVDVYDEWMKIDIVWPIKRWFGNHELSHLIHISCQSCDNNSIDEMISVDEDYRPFIMIDTQNRRLPSRQKRSINCTNGITECCREKLYISFDDIGWGDWIIQPRGYDAYFCRGTCGTIASVTQSSTHHSSFVQKILSTRRGNGRKPLELIPCCTAKQYSSLQLVFMDSNNTATQKTFPNMVVESCGCR